MEIGISTASFFNKKTTEEAVKYLYESGAKSAEVFLTSPCEYEEVFARKVKRMAGNMSIHSVHTAGVQYEPQLFSRNARVREDAEKVFIKTLRAAQILGAEFQTFHGIVQMRRNSNPFNEETLAKRFNELVETASEYGIKIALENVHYTITPSPHEIKLILDACPGLYATLDVKQAIYAGYDATDYIGIMGRRLATVHLCDVTINNAPCMPPKGSYNFKRLFDMLKQEGVKAPAYLEVYGDSYMNCSELLAAADMLRELANPPAARKSEPEKLAK